MNRGTYNILVIPEGGTQIRRIRLSRVTAKTLLFGSGVGLSLIVAGLIGWLGTLRSLRARETRLAAVSSFEGEKQLLEQRLTSLQQGLERTQAIAARLEKLVGVEERQGEVGVGPIAESPLFPDRDTPLAARVDDLLDRSSSLEQQVNRAYEVGQDQVILLASTPSIWPTQGWITSDFGYRRSPMSGRFQFHEGIDIASRWGSPIVAPADGIVTFAGYRAGYGKTIVIDHGFGVETVYCHNSRVLVQKGIQVERGTKIASVGSTGRTTGPHLHYEVHVDTVPVDPVKYILR